MISRNYDFLYNRLIPKFRVERVNLKTYYRSLFHCILDDLSNNNHYTRSPCYILLKGRNRSCCKKFSIEFHISIKDCLKKELTTLARRMAYWVSFPWAISIGYTLHWKNGSVFESLKHSKIYQPYYCSRRMLQVWYSLTFFHRTWLKCLIISLCGANSCLFLIDTVVFIAAVACLRYAWSGGGG